MGYMIVGCKYVSTAVRSFFLCTSGTCPATFDRFLLSVFYLSMIKAMVTVSVHVHDAWHHYFWTLGRRLRATKILLGRGKGGIPLHSRIIPSQNRHPISLDQGLPHSHF